MNVENSERIRGVVSTLIQASCYDSAESLCCLHLSSLRRTEDANSIRLTPLFLELLGDIIFKKGEFKRALSYYRQSSQQRNLGLIANSRKRSNSIENSSDSQLRYKEGQCHIELKDYTTAIRELEAIPALLRDLKINMCMGKLYKSANLKRHAISCFILVIREVPSAVEAIDALVSLGIESGELLTLLDESCRASADSALYADGWLHTLSTSLIMKRNYEHDKCEIKLSTLLTTYPKNLHLLVLLGKNALNGDNVDAAMSYFKQARRVDPLAVDFMDQYGLLLAKTGEETELNKLAHELLGLSSEKPIGWLLVAMYCDLKRDSEKAMQFVEKAINQDNKYAPGFRLKGHFLLSNGHPEQAVIAFYQSNTLEKDITSFSGLIQAYLAVGKFKDAISTAKEAIATLPRSATAFCMMGKVLSQVPEGINEAVRAYSKALRLCPANATAASGLAEALITQGKLEEAILSLRSVLNKKASSELRVILAKALSLQGFHGDAIAQLHSALSMSPVDPVSVTREMERIELLMRGGAGDDNIEDDGGSHISDAVEVDEEPFSELGEDGQGQGEGEVELGEIGEDSRSSRRHFEHSGHGNSLDLDGEEDEEEEEEDDERDRGREEGVLLDYDDEQMMPSPPLHGSGSIDMARPSDSWRTAGSARQGQGQGQGQGQTSYSTPDRVTDLNS